MSEPRALILKVGIGTNVSSVVVVSYVVVASAGVVTSAVVVGISVVAVSVAVEAESSTLALCDFVASVEVWSSFVDVTLIDNSPGVVVAVTTSVVVVESAIDPVEDADTGSVDTALESLNVRLRGLHTLAIAILAPRPKERKAAKRIFAQRKE